MRMKKNTEKNTTILENTIFQNASPRKTHLEAIEERFPIHAQSEDAKLCSGSSISAKRADQTVRFKDISKTEMTGFPMRVFRDASGELNATFSPDTHAMIIGSTGSGKTTGFVLPFLHWMSSKKNKPSIVVSDPKNELRPATVNRFIQNGYRVLWLNFQDYSVSDCWNPLTPIYRLYQKYLSVEQAVEVVTVDGKAYNRFRGKTYTEQNELNTAILAEKDGILAEVANRIGNISEAVSPISKKEDPYWDTSAATLVRGFLWAMLEDSAPDKTEGRITEETYSFDTLLNIYDSFTTGNQKTDDHGYFGNRNPETSRAYQLVYNNIITLSANTTRSCIMAVFAEKVKKFRDTSVRRITCANTFDMESFDDDECPIVLFISYKDEDSLYYEVISMFISDLYTALIGTSRRKKGALERPFYFLLDEFGNFPRFRSFENVISACRSRNIWFFLIVQSYAQLERVYDKETSEIIKDNLNMHLFLGSCNYETKAAFSQECGRHEITSSLSAINGGQQYIERYEKELVPLVPVSRLSMLEDGECIITQMQGDVIWSKIERSYLCPEYKVEAETIADRESPIPFFDSRYHYDIGWLVNASRPTIKRRNPLDWS